MRGNTGSEADRAERCHGTCTNVQPTLTGNFPDHRNCWRLTRRPVVRRACLCCALSSPAFSLFFLSFFHFSRDTRPSVKFRINTPQSVSRRTFIVPSRPPMTRKILCRIFEFPSNLAGHDTPTQPGSTRRQGGRASLRGSCRFSQHSTASVDCILPCMIDAIYPRLSRTRVSLPVLHHAQNKPKTSCRQGTAAEP